MRRYLTSAIEQALGSLLNLGVNLMVIQLVALEQYGAFALWANTAFVIGGLQSTLTLIHLQVAHGAHVEQRLSLERLMHAVTKLFLAVSAIGVLTAALVFKAHGNPVGAPAAALFIPAFLAQQHVRRLAFSGGHPTTAAVQTGAVLLIATTLITFGELAFKPLSANLILTLMALAYGVVAVGGFVATTRGQGGARPGSANTQPMRGRPAGYS